jgi:dihydroneopterin triphosphate diphosphatase
LSPGGEAPVSRRAESVLVVVHTQAGEVLVLRRVDPHDFWQSVTGALLPRETPVEAARREVVEETGITALESLVDTGIVREFPIVGPWRARYSPQATTNREHAFTLALPERLPVRLAQGEHAEHVWLPAAEAAGRVASWTNRDAILRLFPPKT